MTQQQKHQYLENLYFDPANPASFRGADAVYKQVKKDNRYQFTHKEIAKWIQNQEAYSRNRAAVGKFRRDRVIVKGIDDQFDADLAQLDRLHRANDGYNYLLCVIDIFSRYAWVKPLKTKEGNEVVRAFNRIISQGRKPERLRTDAGREFTSGTFQNYCKRKKIRHFTTHNETQANYAERFIKTLKTKIFRYLNHTNKERYIDVLPDIVEAYNNTFHSGIQSEPINVTKENENKLWWQMYWPKTKCDPAKFKKRKKLNLFTFQVGDYVRISAIRHKFTREYDEKWTAEIFKVARRYIRRGMPIYKLKDWYGEDIKGSFYQKELQKVENAEEATYKIERPITKYRGRRPNREAYVSWVGWPKKFNTWIPESEIKDI